MHVKRAFKIVYCCCIKVFSIQLVFCLFKFICMCSRDGLSRCVDLQMLELVSLASRQKWNVLNLGGGGVMYKEAWFANWHMLPQVNF